MTHPTIILKATQACNNDFGRGRQQSMQCIEMEKKCDRRNSSRLSRTRKKRKGTRPGHMASPSTSKELS